MVGKAVSCIMAGGPAPFKRKPRALKLPTTPPDGQRPKSAAGAGFWTGLLVSGVVAAVISVVLGVHFPLGDIPWDELEKGRAWLADLVAETG